MPINKLFLKKAALLCLSFCVTLISFSQKEKITGRWKPVRIVMETVPEGIDINWAEKRLYEDIHKRLDSAGKKTELDAADSIKVKALAQDAVDEVFRQIYFRFNPDNTCYINLGKLLDETAVEGTIIKGKYKINDQNRSVTITPDKSQTINGEKLNGKNDKVSFYYSFKNDGQLRLEMDDGTLVFYLVKDE